MDIKEKAAGYHDRGFNCAQSVLCACGEYTGLDEKSALAAAGGFGGGVRCGEICGSITSAVMALGLANPYNTEGDTEAKDKIAQLTKRCIKRFQDEFGCIRCVELKRSGHRCDELITFAAGLAEDMILSEKGEQNGNL